MRVTFTGVMMVLLVLVVAVTAVLVGASLGANWMKNVSPARVTVIPVIVQITTTPLPAPTQMPLPTQTISVLPTFTPTATLAPVVYAPSLNCSDPVTLNFIDENNEVFADGRFDRVVKQARSHFNTGTDKNHKRWIDTGELGDAYLKIGNVLEDVIGLNPPWQLKKFHDSQIAYLKSLWTAFKAGQNGNKASQDKAWDALEAADDNKNSMDYQASLYYTCGLHLYPSK